MIEGLREWWAALKVVMGGLAVTAFCLLYVVLVVSTVAIVVLVIGRNWPNPFAIAAAVVVAVMFASATVTIIQMGRDAWQDRKAAKASTEASRNYSE